MAQEKEMSFLAHLEELRWHLVRSAIAILIVAVGVFVFMETIFDQFILAHLKGDFITYRAFCKAFSSVGIETDFCTIAFPDTLQSIKMMSQLMNAIWTSVVLGIIVSFPYILWEFWRFIAPGLHTTEIKKSRGFIFVSSFLFFLGALFSFFVIIPISVFFFFNFQVSDAVNNQFTLGSYISLFTNTMLGVSIMFELPVIIYFLSKIGLITPMFLKRYRKHALVLVLILSAIITPPDIASQVIVSIPILILYEISITVSKRIYKKQQKNAIS
jgi:sec-independent protein translocase protein TatC